MCIFFLKCLNDRRTEKIFTIDFAFREIKKELIYMLRPFFFVVLNYSIGSFFPLLTVLSICCV